MKLEKISLYISFAFLSLWILTGLFSDILSADKPIYSKTKDDIAFPLFDSNSDIEFKDRNDAISTIWPLIPFSSSTLDIENTGSQPPGTVQIKKGGQFTHYLGTDHLGRDVAAGLISGASITLKIVFYSLILSSVFGIFLGLISGYFGDKGLKTSITRVLFFFSLVLIFIFHFIGDSPVLSVSLFIWLFFCSILYFALKKFQIGFMKKNINIPLDLLLSRFLEIFDSIPKILLLIAIFAGFSPSLELVIILIALISWPAVTKIVRAETLVEKNKNYIDAGKTLGFTNARLIFIHILPNIIAPVLILITFNAGSIILIESSLSFLGLGMPPDVQTWGRMLAMAKNHLSSWWLVFFPGFFIFATVFSLNTIGRHLGTKFQYKKRQQLLI